MNKSALIIALAVVGTVAAFLVFHNPSASSFRGQLPNADTNLEAQFAEWKIQNGKTYGGAENQYRFTVWTNNFYQVQAINAEQSSYTVGMNLFADLTQEEFASIYLGYKPGLSTSAPIPNTSYKYTANPTSVDWRTKGAVTPIKNQGQCGSCWAFSTTGSLEGTYQIATGNLVSFSEQQLVDCSSSYGNMGCDGGLMDNAFRYVEAKGIMKESDYPYTGVDGSCKYNAAKVVYKINSYTDVTPDNENDLESAVATKPVSIAIEADQSSFQLYTKGVITKGCGTALDHGVLAVGYNSAATPPYWIVKNSWGASWGMAGYVQIAMGTQNNGEGECGLMQEPSYPVYSS